MFPKSPNAAYRPWMKNRSRSKCCDHKIHLLIHIVYNFSNSTISYSISEHSRYSFKCFSKNSMMTFICSISPSEAGSSSNNVNVEWDSSLGAIAVLIFLTFFDRKSMFSLNESSSGSRLWVGLMTGGCTF